MAAATATTGGGPVARIPSAVSTRLGPTGAPAGSTHSVVVAPIATVPTVAGPAAATTAGVLAGICAALSAIATAGRGRCSVRAAGCAS